MSLSGLWSGVAWINPGHLLVSVFGPDWFVLFCYSFAWFLAGVSYAIYRAVDWVERMRAWARAVELAERSPGIAGDQVDSMGVN